MLHFFTSPVWRPAGMWIAWLHVVLIWSSLCGAQPPRFERHTVRYQTDYGYPQTIKTMALAPDGRRLVVAAAGKLDVIDADSGNVVNTIKANPHTLGFSRDGRRILAISSYDRQLIDPRTTETRKVSFSVPPGYLGLSLETRNGKLLVSSISPDGPIAKIPEIAIGDEVTAVARGDRSRALKVLGNANSAQAALKGPAGTHIQLTIIHKGEFEERVYRLRRQAGEPRGNVIRFVDPQSVEIEDNVVLTARDEWFELSSVATGQPFQWLDTLDISHQGQQAISPDQRRMAMIGKMKEDDGYGVEVFDIATAERVAMIPHQRDSFFALEFSPNAEEVLIGTWDSIEVLDIQQQRLTRRLTLGWTPPPRKKKEESRNRDTGIVAATASDALSYGRQGDARSPRRLLSCMAVSQLGFVATGDLSGVVRLWDYETGRLLAELPTGGTDEIQMLQVASSGDRLAFFTKGVLHLVAIPDLALLSPGEIGDSLLLATED